MWACAGDGPRPSFLLFADPFSAVTQTIAALDEASKLEFFEQRIRPVLASACYECHSTHGEQRGGVVLDHRAGIRAEGSEGPIVVPGEPEESVLLMVTRHELEGLEMPEDGARLGDDVLADLEGAGGARGGQTRRQARRRTRRARGLSSGLRRRSPLYRTR